MDKSCNNKKIRGYGLNTGGVLAKDLTMVLSMFVRLRVCLVGGVEKWKDKKVGG